MSSHAPGVPLPADHRAPATVPESGVQARAPALALALVLTIAAWAVPSWWGIDSLWQANLGGIGGLDRSVLDDLALLLMGLMLAGSAPRRSGLCIGSIRQHWQRVLAICGLPVLLTALVYPRLPVRPFAGAGAEMWLISPLAQDLIFMGFLYGHLYPHFQAPLHPRVGLPWALPVTALFFAIWHLPNLSWMPAGYVGFQLLYTASGFVLTGLSRHWTGSLLYASLSHTAVNLVAWLTS